MSEAPNEQAAENRAKALSPMARAAGPRQASDDDDLADAISRFAASPSA
jgi:hypothetical protein